MQVFNIYEKSASFTLPGNPDLLAGVPVAISGWGAWDGNYMVKQAKHTVSGSGYKVQVGTVSAVDQGKRRVRVKHQATGISSGWLYVLQHNPVSVDLQQGGNPAHTHAAQAGYWMPQVNDAVIILYTPIEDGDGYVLGGV